VLGAQDNERDMLNGFLDWNRAVIANKVAGLSRADATRTMTPSGLHPLGVVAHLTAAEIGWFDETFAGEPERAELAGFFAFRVGADETVESVVAAYDAACARSREVVAATASLDELSARESDFRGRVSLRWVLVHMIEETARHAGHLDLMRERIDGRTGD
jgi:hypothetical protein